MIKRSKILCLCLVLCLLVALLASCSGGKAMMTLEDKTLSVNTYEFLLSRMKGTLAYYGYGVQNDKFFNTVISSDGMTYNEYFGGTIRREASHYLIADYLFDKEGLTFTDADEAEIDKIMDTAVKRAGSRAALNSALKEYGVNYNMLRDIYVLESKIVMLKEHFCGKDGSLISVEDKEKYLDENYVCFKQIFIATYSYVTDKDRFGDVVYYTDEKHKEIAYDKQNGVTKQDEFGKPIKDVLGDVEYFTAEGKIAYDKKNGVIGYVTDDNGDKLIKSYSDAKKGEILAAAEKYAVECNGDAQKFAEYVQKYDESESSDSIYLYSSAGYYAAQNDAVAYFDDIAKLLSTMKTGECRVFESEYGAHVLLKCDNQDGAYADEANKDAFADFTENIIESIFDGICTEYEDQIVFDEDVAANAPDMKEVGANTKY